MTTNLAAVLAFTALVVACLALVLAPLLGVAAVLG